MSDTSKVLGQTEGLKPSQFKALARLTTRRYPSAGVLSPEQARELAALSSGLNRQLGLIIDRKGKAVLVLVGSPTGILIPELPRERSATGRLRGLRLVHTHLQGEELSQEDLTDLLFLRLDSVAALALNAYGEPMRLHLAHLLPKPGPDGRPWRVLPSLPAYEPDIDLGAQTAAIEEEMARVGSQAEGKVSEERAILVAVSGKPRPVMESSLDELAELARTAGVQSAGRMLQRTPRVDPKTILGKGKLSEVEIMALSSHAGMLIFDGELSPAQIRNLSEMTERKILDRSQLILDIFAQRAHSKAGKLQVELAQLKYVLPRLVGQNKALSRLAGGIGGRGPGETKLEMDRRKIRERITKVKDELKKVRRHRQATRSRRAKAGLPVVSLVGYTNAGKSTLLNALTGAEVLAEDKLFATLDPTSRRLRFPNELEIVLTDTVGFISELPDELKEAFKATLEELEEADLLVHVVDASHPARLEHMEAVDAILTEMELGAKPRLLVLNKWDLASPEDREWLASRFPEAVALSAKTRQGLDALSEAVIRQVAWRDEKAMATAGMIKAARENSLNGADGHEPPPGDDPDAHEEPADLSDAPGHEQD